MQKITDETKKVVKLHIQNGHTLLSLASEKGVSTPSKRLLINQVLCFEHFSRLIKPSAGKNFYQQMAMHLAQRHDMKQRIFYYF